MPSAPLLAQEPSRLVETKASAGAAAALQGLVDGHSLAGAVTLVASKDAVLSLETVGFADVEARKPMQQDSLFWIASMTKTFTAAAFMMLVDEGKVKLDDPVEKYLPEFKGQMVLAEKDAEHVLLKKPVHPITLREALSHTSGLAFKAAFEDPTLDMLSLPSTVHGYAGAPLLFQPTTDYLYSNEGINTAGRVIEVVSGMPYEDFLQKRLLDPLGLKDTTFWPTAEQVSRLAKSYKGNSAKTGLEEVGIWALHYPLDDRHRSPMPGGGLFSTAQDVGRFCQMLLNGGMCEGKRLLSETSLQEITRRQTAPGLKTSYGLGCQVAEDNFGHGGAYATNMTVYPKQGLVLVYLVQHGGWRDEEGKKGAGIFKKAAFAAFAK